VNFTEVYFGEEAAALVVSNDVWQSGVHSLTKAQATDIYEQKIRNWKEVGGPDLPVTGYTPEQGRSVWACYIQWLYDDPARIRPNRFATVTSDEEAKGNMEATPGSVTTVSMLFAIAKNLHRVSIKNADGTITDPSPASVASHTYPMSRPLLLVVKGRPLGEIKTMVDFMLSDRGQEFVRKHNYLTLKDLGVAPQTFE